MAEWQPIKTYPAKPDAATGCKWGPEVLVLCATPYGPTKFLAHLEANEWLCRAADDACSWGALKYPPAYWFQVPETIKDIHTDPKMMLGL